MTANELARFKEAINGIGEDLWDKASEVAKQEEITPRDIWKLVGRPVGAMHGLAAAMGWHVKHEEEGDVERTV